MSLRCIERMQLDAVGDRDGAIAWHALREQAATYALRAAHDSVRALRQPARLREAPPCVAFAGVVLHVHQMRHARKQAGIASPQVFAEAVRDENVGAELPAYFDETPYCRGVRPAGRDAQRYVFAPQALHACIVGVALASEHQQGSDALAGARRLHQRYGDLGGAAGETAGYEVQYA